jgi:hypothetical protein
MSSSWWKLKHGVTRLTIDCVIVIANVCQTVGHSSMNKVHVDAVHHCVLTSEIRTTHSNSGS